MKDSVLAITFLIYTLVWESIIWFGGFYIILVYSWSPWWVVLMMTMSGAQLKPKHWRELFYDGVNEDESDERRIFVGREI